MYIRGAGFYPARRSHLFVGADDSVRPTRLPRSHLLFLVYRVQTQFSRQLEQRVADHLFGGHICLLADFAVKLIEIIRNLYRKFFHKSHLSQLG